MTLKAQIHSDVEDVFLNVSDFGETFVYCPKGGARRDIVGVVTSAQVEVIETDSGKQNRHVMNLFVARDATTGIDEPQLGDGLWRKSAESDEGFSYGGMADDPDSNDGTAYAGELNGHTLLFLRYTPYKFGGNRIL